MSLRHPVALESYIEPFLHHIVFDLYFPDIFEQTGPEPRGQMHACRDACRGQGDRRSGRSHVWAPRLHLFARIGS